MIKVLKSYGWLNDFDVGINGKNVPNSHLLFGRVMKQGKRGEFSQLFNRMIDTQTK